MDRLKLSRGERFVEARTKYNRHGKQTTHDVAKATGVSASAINALENDDIQRDVGYEKVTLLAKHYGVTTDWLLGLTDDPSPQPSAVDELGLSPEAIYNMRWISTLKETHIILNRILESNYLHHLIMKIYSLNSSIDASMLRTKRLDWLKKHKKIPDSPNELFDEQFEEYSFRLCETMDSVSVYEEIIKKYPYLSGRLHVDINNDAIDRAKQDCLRACEYVIDDVGNLDKYNEFMKARTNKH